MPSGSQHIQQASHNIDFLSSFYKSRKYNDWAITVGFYAALHILENAIFIKKQLTYQGKLITIEHADDLPDCASQQKIPPPKNLSSTPITPHKFRNILVQENFPDVADFYMLLYRQSRTSRYKKYQFSDNEVTLLAKAPMGAIVEWSNKNFSTSFSLALA